MDHLNRIFLSNRTEQLYEDLKRELYTSVHPMAKRVVIVPSSPMKTWLMLRMARDPDLGVAAGVKIAILEPELDGLLKQLNDDPIKEHYVPNPTELSFAIEDIVSKIIEDGDVAENEWQPLLRYLGVSEKKQNRLTRQGRKRLSHLSLSLAKIFREYGIYGERMIASWKERKSDHWQALIWQKLEKLFFPWGYQSSRIDAFKMKSDILSEDMQIHLFGLSYFAPINFNLFRKIGQKLPVHFYLISPCEKFWGDILSDKEGYRLKDFYMKRRMKEGEIFLLDELLRDTNPLLANFGRLGREMASLLEKTEAVTQEQYLFSSDVCAHPQYEELLTGEELVFEGKGTLTLLEAVQADVTLLRNPGSSGKIRFEQFDHTIQVHETPKISREVEVVYDLILGIIDRHKDTDRPITPGDIFVMAPNITDYAPFIKAHFESPESRLDIQLMDHYSPSHHSFVQGFIHLLELSRGRWEASSLIDLFEHPAFRSKNRLSGDDLGTIRRWVSVAKIRWGKDEEHRKQVFGRDYEGKVGAEGFWGGTWEHGFGCLLEGMALIANEEEEELSAVDGAMYSPLEAIESAKAELLGRVIQLIRSLQSDLKILHDGTSMTLDEWSAYLRSLSEAYFSGRDADGEIEGAKVISGIIDTIGRASSRLVTAKYPFDTIHTQIQELLSAQSGSYKEGNVHSVRFSSLQPMRALPARVVVLMGMNDGEFPRVEPLNPLNLLKGNPNSDYVPEQVDYDRYLFLEALLSSRDYFVMTYISQDPGSSQIKSPSILVGELREYIDAAYELSNSDGHVESLSSCCHFKHHLQPFNKGYFMSKSRFRSYFLPHFRAAQSYYAKSQIVKPFLVIPPYGDDKREDVAEECTIELQELTAFAKNPLKRFFKQFGVTIPRDRRYSINDDGELLMSRLNRTIVLNKSVEKLSNLPLNRLVESGLIPQGTFSPNAKSSLINEHESLLSELNKMGIDPDNLYTIEFRSRYKEPKCVGKTWLLPPLRVSSEAIGEISIVGKMEAVSVEGVIQYSKHSEGKEFEKLPLLLVFGALIEQFHLPFGANILLCRDDKVKKIALPEADSMNILAQYLSYYFTSSKQPSPLLPDFISIFLKAEDGSIAEHIKPHFENSFNEIYDTQLKWLWRNCTSRGSGLEGSVQTWKELITSLNPAMSKKKSRKKSGGGE